jgi:uncharacterized protein (TIGR00369 family)
MRSRTFQWSDPAEAARRIETMSGLDYLRSLRDRTIDEPPITRLVGLAILEAEEGRVVIEFIPGEWHYNPFNTVHGGISCAVLDSAAGCAVYSMLPAGVGYTSVDLKANFIRPITTDVGPMRCEGRIVHLGSRTGIAEARLTDRADQLYAWGVSMCMIFQPGRK